MVQTLPRLPGGFATGNTRKETEDIIYEALEMQLLEYSVGLEDLFEPQSQRALRRSEFIVCIKLFLLFLIAFSCPWIKRSFFEYFGTLMFKYLISEL